MTVVIAGSQEMFQKRGHLFMVADGMGAHAAGELASKLATDTVAHTYQKLLDRAPPEALVEAMTEANAFAPIALLLFLPISALVFARFRAPLAAALLFVAGVMLRSRIVGRCKTGLGPSSGWSTCITRTRRRYAWCRPQAL